MITDKQVETVATQVLTATRDAEGGKVNYLRTLLEATQDELKGKKGQEANAQLGALSTVHERFYAIVLEAAQPFVPKTQKDRSITLHAKINFARTALSRLRGHVKAGGDLVALNASKAVTSSLQKREGPSRPLSPARWKTKAETQSKALVATLMGLADADKAAAIEEIQLVLGQLATQLVTMGVLATKDAAQSLAEHRPLKIGKTLFMPTQTQVIAQQARPS